MSAQLAKSTRAAMREKARLRASEEVNIGRTMMHKVLDDAEKEYPFRTPAMKAKARLVRKAGGAVEMGVAGAKADARADRKPRVKKEGGGPAAPADSLGMRLYQSLPSSLRRNPRITPAELEANAAMATGVAGATGGLARLAPRVAAPLLRGTRAEGATPRVRPEPYRAEGTVNVSPSVPPIPRGSPRSLFMAANRAAELGLGNDGPVRTGPVVDPSAGMDPENLPTTLVVPPRANSAAAPSRPPPNRPRSPAMLGPETTSADRLNDLSLGMSRSRESAFDETPQNTAEMQAQRNIAARRISTLDPRDPTNTSPGNQKRGGRIKSMLKDRKSKPGKPRR